MSSIFVRRKSVIFSTCLNRCIISPIPSKFASVKLYSSHTFDLAIVGGGIVGAAVGRELSARFPSLSIALVEKEDGLGKFSSLRS